MSEKDRFEEIAKDLIMSLSEIDFESDMQRVVDVLTALASEKDSVIAAKDKEIGELKKVLECLIKFKKQFEAFSRYQGQHLTKGLKEAEQCWPEVSDSGMLDFNELFKAIEAYEKVKGD